MKKSIFVDTGKTTFNGIRYRKDYRFKKYYE
jgi:hypothetical protein